MDASLSTDGNGKRSRKPKTFAGYVTDTNEDYFQEGPRPAADHQQPPPPKRRRSTSSASTIPTPRRNQQQSSSSSSSGIAGQPAAAGGSVKKVAGVQNATRRALEWLQYGDLSVAELTQSLPKLSKARVEIVMEALRAAGLVTLVRKHAPDAAGEDHVTKVYRFSAGRSAAEALDIGGGKPVALGSISKRIKASQAELTGLNERINVLKEAAKSDPDPEQAQEILRQFMKQDKSLEEDPFYSVAYKATCAATAKAAAAAARTAALAQAKKKAAEDAAAAAAAAALSAAAETKRKADEVAREQQAAAVEARRKAEEGAKAVPAAAEVRAIATINAASAASTAAAVAAAAFSAAAFSAALPSSSVGATSISSSVVSAAPSSSLPAVEMRIAPATPAPCPPPAVATAVAESPAPFVGELGGLVVSGMISPHSIAPPPPGRPS